MENPKVSVSIITYNHEKYIAQALDSVLRQETDFEYEIILGEDESQDGTRKICIEYARRYPDRIRLFLRSRKNVIYINGRPTGRFNFVENLKAIRGKYIAVLDGDDYWTKPYKLQKQVDFLESHPDHSICFTRAAVFSEDNSYQSYEVPAIKGHIQSLVLEDLLRDNPMATCSVMFRRGLFAELPSWYFKLAFGDWPLHILNAQYGKVGYIPEVMAAYRLHAGGVYSSRRVIDNLFEKLKFYKLIDKHLNRAHHQLICEMIAQKYQEIAVRYWRDKKPIHACYYSTKSLSNLPLSRIIANKFFVKKFLSIIKNTLKGKVSALTI